MCFKMNGRYRFIFLNEGEGLDIYYEAANPCEHEADNLRSEESKNNVRLSCARFFLEGCREPNWIQ